MEQLITQDFLDSQVSIKLSKYWFQIKMTYKLLYYRLLGTT